MLAAGVITTSQAPYYSQVHLVPKPNGKWRFTIDFRNLNDCCEQAGWPLPNISLMLQRIGTKKPRLYCKFDMTEGYHQFPLHPNSYDATTFITANGLYRFQRVVMGLSGSGSNFQARMSTEVLTGLLYIICESYLDDILLFAKSETQLLLNLKQILARFRSHHILLNPDKVEIGLEQLEFVGHLIDSTGVHMTQTKLDSVRNFPKPILKGDMKKFLGLANYFRDHVRDHSVLAYPLQQAIEGYSRKDRHHKVRWTTDLETAYEALKAAICNCQKLHFINEEYEVWLQTDASDYGIGAYLKQISPQGDVPIMFISKSLDKTQCRWSTPEKEMFAIWYALQKMDHLLRDIHFHIQTDHENLTRHKVTGSPKVLRWKLDIQQFNFTIEHIKGTDNVVADDFSRQCDRIILPDEEDIAALLSFQCEKLDIEYCAALDPEECYMQYLYNDDEPVATTMEGAFDSDYLELAALGDDEITSIPDKAYKAINKVHNSLTGHHGVDKTMLKLTRVGNNWPYMREHIRLFIKACPCCQKMSNLRVPIHTTPFTTSSYAPMQVINIDSIGPLPTDSEGNQYILSIVLSTP